MSRSAEFEAVLRDTHAVIRAYIAGFGVPLDAVDDVAQDVYLEFYKGFDHRPSEVEPIRWLKGISKNLCLNYFRSCKRKAERELEAVAVRLESAGTTETMIDGDDALDGCLERLPTRSRLMVELRYAEGLGSAEIGRRVGLSAEAVRIALLRIRVGLRECLENRLAEGIP